MENASNGKMLQKGYEEEGRQEEREPWNENKNGEKKNTNKQCGANRKKVTNSFQKNAIFLGRHTRGWYEGKKGGGTTRLDHPGNPAIAKQQRAAV